MQKAYRLFCDIGGIFSFEDAELVNENNSFLTIIDKNSYAINKNIEIKAVKYLNSDINPLPYWFKSKKEALEALIDFNVKKKNDTLNEYHQIITKLVRLRELSRDIG